MSKCSHESNLESAPVAVRTHGTGSQFAGSGREWRVWREADTRGVKWRSRRVFTVKNVEPRGLGDNSGRSVRGRDSLAIQRHPDAESALHAEAERTGILGFDSSQ
jgi:hypothetical protein